MPRDLRVSAAKLRHYRTYFRHPAHCFRDHAELFRHVSTDFRHDPINFREHSNVFRECSKHFRAWSRKIPHAPEQFPRKRAFRRKTRERVARVSEVNWREIDHVIRA
jgi:hypothetical protein